MGYLPEANTVWHILGMVDMRHHAVSLAVPIGFPAAPVYLIPGTK